MDKHRPDINISADEINALIHSYLVDSGFIHSAFVLRGEANLDRSPLAAMLFPRGQLTELLAKSLLYIEVETHWNQPAGSCNQPFSLTSSHTCKGGTGKETSALATTTFGDNELRDLNKSDQDEEMDYDSSTPEPLPPGKNELPQVFQRFLPPHKSEVFQCSWSPGYPEILATGSKDSTAVIWNLDLSTTVRPMDQKVATIQHCTDIPVEEEERDVSCIEWSRGGAFLATGSMDPYVRVWSKSRNGPLFTLKEHTDTIGLVRFAPNSKFLLSQGLDRTTVLWDVEKAKMIRKVQAPPAPGFSGIQDIAWINDTSYACSWSGGLIHVYVVTSPMPFRIFRGHEDEVNVIRTSPDRKLLATGAEDANVRIWSLQPLKIMVVAGEFVPAEGSVGGEAEKGCLHVLKGHKEPVMQMRWVPPTDHTPQRLLISCGDDYYVCIWDTIEGTLVKVIKDHKSDVYGLSISPDSRFCVTASMDNWLYIFSIENNWELVQSWTDRTKPTRPLSKGQSKEFRKALYEVDWHQDGKRLAVCTASGSIVILDVSHLQVTPAPPTQEIWLME